MKRRITIELDISHHETREGVNNIIKGVSHNVVKVLEPWLSAGVTLYNVQEEHGVGAHAAITTSAACEETTGMRPVEEQSPGSDDYVRCGAQAAAIVLSERGKRLYFMCHGCAYHNVHNRGVVLVGSIVDI
jgi:hypothetical protein